MKVERVCIAIDSTLQVEIDRLRWTPKWRLFKRWRLRRIIERKRQEMIDAFVRGWRR